MNQMYLQCKPQKSRAILIYFGIARSISYTHENHKKFLIEPLSSAFDLSIHAYFVYQDSILSPKTGENSRIDYSTTSLLNIEKLVLMHDVDRQVESHFRLIKSYGDSGWDNFFSTKNLLKQLISLDAAASAALQEKYKFVVFCRPDLLFENYLCSDFSSIQLLKERNQDTVLLPFWGSWSGFNDRLSICIGTKAIEAYGRRLSQVNNFCDNTSSPLHSERLLAYSLISSDINIKKLDANATRVRDNGVVKTESFAEERVYLNYFIFAHMSLLRRVKRIIKHFIRLMR